MPKFKEIMISETTKWKIENADFSNLMDEFRIYEKKKVFDNSKKFGKEILNNRDKWERDQMIDHEFFNK